MPNVLRFVPKTPSLPRAEAPRALVRSAAGSAAITEPPAAAARTNLARLSAGVAREITVAQAVGARIVPPPKPPAAPTLQDLVVRGRRVLHDAQNKARSAELDQVSKAADKLAAALTTRAPAPIGPPTPIRPTDT